MVRRGGSRRRPAHLALAQYLYAMALTSVAEATAAVLQHPLDFGVEKIALAEAAGRILAQPLVADRDFPPFDRVTMDGIAIAFQSWEAGQRRWHIESVQAAGQPPQELRDAQQGAIEVMTGAMMPTGTDTVIRYEDLVLDAGIASTLSEVAVTPCQNRHLRGSDAPAGRELVPVGVRLSAGELGLGATVGAAWVSVKRLPRVLVVSTGNEIVAVDAQPQAYQIRSSNAYTIAAALETEGVIAERLHLPDDQEIMARALAEVLEAYDLVVLSGGVSAGKFDFIPQVLTTLGVSPVLHQVAQRPGKPLWFGTYRQQAVVFGLPGNPVSTLMCALRYVLPWVRHSLGLTPLPAHYATLATPLEFSPALTLFQTVALHCKPDGRYWAEPLQGNGSGDLAIMGRANGFLELPADRNSFAAGEVFPGYTWR